MYEEHPMKPTSRAEVRTDRARLGAEANAPVQQTPATETVIRAENLAEQLQSLAERLDRKLRPVLGRESPIKEMGQDKVQQEYPPLFEELRTRLTRFEESMKYIEYTLNRIEL
jgi:hypothetical protein